ncbi:AAA family ATPase [Kocuria sp. ICS0012]|uniref:AAA family ATPase n=1 Tax=Kocuria sp. ICS0012 TaxID=1834155 RepID=UPI0007EBF48D|nr:AAA family ATPase [Kocuria sp. ICS0012]OBA48300.1 ATPase [Kocuria sp. ICS0012]
MSTTTEAATWPRVEATLHEDGTAEVSIGGSVQTINAQNVDEARPQVVALIAQRAAQLGRPLRALTRDPEGEWPIIIHGDGTVAEDAGAAARPPAPAEPPAIARTEPSPPPAPAHELTVAPIEPLAPEPVSQPVATEPAAETSGHSRGWVRSAAEQAEELSHLSTPYPTRRERRQSFLTQEQAEEPAAQGWRGILTRAGLRLSPSPAERAERADIAAVSQHWPGPRTIAIVNSKGGAGKTPSTVLLAAVFARYGGAGVLTWDNNQTRGTLGWRTEQGPHDATLLELLPQVERLLSPSAQAADLARFVHHQTRDRFDVLRSKPTALAHEQRVEPEDVDAIHAVASKYYRLVFIDSGNDESDPMWLRMIDRTDQLVVATTTRDDHAEAGALLLEALSDRDERSAHLAEQAVVVVTQADSKAPPADVARVADGYRVIAREAVTVPFDPAMVDGLLRYGSLRPGTQRAWLAAAAAVARGL